SAALETSTRMQAPPFARRAVSCSPFSSTSASASFMPSFANASAIARPRPLAAPVIAAVLPCRVFIVRSPSMPFEPLVCLRPERVAELLAEKAEMTDAAHAEVRRLQVAQFGARLRIELQQLAHRAERAEGIVAEGVGANGRGEARVALGDAEVADEIRRVAAPARPLDRHAFRQVLAKAEPGPREIAEKVGEPRQCQVRHRPHPCARGQGPVAPIAALRADDQRRGDALHGQQAERLAAEAVADDADLARAEEIHGGDGIEQRPVPHARAHLAHAAAEGLADAAVVEGQHPPSLLREPGREPRVVTLRHAGRRQDQHALRSLFAIEGRAQAAAVGGSEGYLHELMIRERPPIRISASMKSTCRWACMRVTSQAATALPGMVATPMTMPVNSDSLSSSANLWKSAALQRSRTMLIIASVASTAVPAMPVPSSSVTMITP